MLESTRTDSISHQYYSVDPATIDAQRVSVFFISQTPIHRVLSKHCPVES